MNRRSAAVALGVMLVLAALAGTAIAGNGHGPPASPGNSANAPGHQKQRGQPAQPAAKANAHAKVSSSHGKSASARGHTKQKGSSSSHASVHSSASASSQSTGGQKVLVCHRTGSATNPFVVISISINGWENGHSKHAGDILLGPSTPGPHSHDASRCVTTTTTTTTTTPTTTTSTTTGSTTTTTTGSTTTTTGSTTTTTGSTTTTTTTGSTTTTTGSTSTTAASGVLGARAGGGKPPAAGGVLGAIARTATRGQLPFTGLPVWVPAFFGLALIGLGLALRRRGRPSGI